MAPELIVYRNPIILPIRKYFLSSELASAVAINALSKPLSLSTAILADS